MAVSIKELIDNKERIEAKKKETFDLATSIGTITAKKISRGLMSEIVDMKSGSDEYCILNSVVDPDLKDPALQKAYGCAEPTDIVRKLFDAGEVSAIAAKIASLSGYGKDIASELHDSLKN